MEPGTLHAVELLGGANRVPCVKECIRSVSGSELSFTLNGSEVFNKSSKLSRLYYYYHNTTTILRLYYLLLHYYCCTTTTTISFTFPDEGYRVWRKAVRFLQPSCRPSSECVHSKLLIVCRFLLRYANKKLQKGTKASKMK